MDSHCTQPIIIIIIIILTVKKRDRNCSSKRENLGEWYRRHDMQAVGVHVLGISVPGSGGAGVPWIGQHVGSDVLKRSNAEMWTKANQDTERCDLGRRTQGRPGIRVSAKVADQKFTRK